MYTVDLYSVLLPADAISSRNQYMENPVLLPDMPTPDTPTPNCKNAVDNSAVVFMSYTFQLPLQ